MIAINVLLVKPIQKMVLLLVLIVRIVVPTPFQKQLGPLPARCASLAERRLLEVFVVPCAQKEQRNTVLMKQLDPTKTITPVSGVLLVIGQIVMPMNVQNAQKDFIPIRPNRIVAKCVKQVVIIQMKRVLVVWTLHALNVVLEDIPLQKESLI
jgi:hypothetical protein